MKKAIFTIILIGIIIMSFFAFGEIIIRSEFLISGRGGYIWIPDDYLGVIHAPNSKFVYEEDFSKEFANRRKTNSLGLVGGQISIKKPANVFRILILGDSFTEGLQVEEGENFCEQLQLLLNEDRTFSNKRFEVINGGISGASPISEFLFFKRELQKLSPDIVILQMFPNDIFEDNKVKAMSLLDTKGYPVKISKFFIKGFSGKVTGSNQVSQLKEFFYKINRFLLSKSACLQSITRAQKKPLKKSHFNKEMGKNPQYNDGNQFFIIQDYNPLFQDINFRNSTMKNTEKYILAIRDLVIKNNAAFLMFLIPPEGQLNLAHYGEHASYFNAGRPNQYLNEQLRQFSVDNGIKFIDFLPVFEKNKDKDLYYSKDGHTKTAGHSLISEALFKYIVKNKI